MDRKPRVGATGPGLRLSGPAARARRRGAGLVPVPGWTDDYEWDGFAPFEHCPRTFNSPDHFLATANQRTTSAASLRTGS